MNKIFFILVFIVQSSIVFSQNNEKFLSAAKDGNFSEVKNWHDKGVDINFTDQNSNTALIWAVRGGYKDIAEFLLLNDCNVNHKNAMKYSAILYAADASDIEILKLLVANNADVNDKTHTGASVLMHAVEAQNEAMVRFLIEKKADVNVWERVNGETALMWAILNRDETIAALLINNGAMVNANQILGFTPLILACKEALFNTVKLLIQKYADPAATDKNGNNCLAHVPLDSNIEIVKFLTGYNYSNQKKLDLEGYNGHVVIKHAVVNGDIDYLKYTFQHRKSKAIDYSAALQLAAQRGQLNIVKYMLEELNADINSSTNEGETALIFAATKNHLKVAEYLLDKGANIDKAKSDGKTAITVATVNGNAEMVNLLMNKGATLNFSDKFNETGAYGSPLMHASALGYLNIVADLLKGGSNINFKNDNGQDALQLAINFNQFNVAEFLIKKGANPNSKNRKGFTVLMLAASKGNLKIVQMLSESGANVNSVNKDKLITALDLANAGKDISDKLKDKDASAKYKEVINYLKGKGAKTFKDAIK